MASIMCQEMTGVAVMVPADGKHGNYGAGRSTRVLYPLLLEHVYCPLTMCGMDRAVFGRVGSATAWYEWIGLAAWLVSWSKRVWG